MREVWTIKPEFSYLKHLIEFAVLHARDKTLFSAIITKFPSLYYLCQTGIAQLTTSSCDIKGGRKHISKALVPNALFLLYEITIYYKTKPGWMQTNWL